MLRISQFNGPNSVLTLKVEGKLRGPWVSVLAETCEERLAAPGCLSLDLTAVTFVDGPGVELLRRLLGRGVALAACSPLVGEFLLLEDR